MDEMKETRCEKCNSLISRTRPDHVVKLVGHDVIPLEIYGSHNFINGETLCGKCAESVKAVEAVQMAIKNGSVRLFRGETLLTVDDVDIKADGHHVELELKNGSSSFEELKIEVLDG